MSVLDEARSRVLDVRTYKLVAGMSAEFDRAFCKRSLPMLERFGIDVVCYGPSADDPDTYYLVRAFDSTAQRDQQLDSFYGSEEWLRNHRDVVLAMIDGYHVAVIELTPATRLAFLTAISAESSW